MDLVEVDISDDPERPDVRLIPHPDRYEYVAPHGLETGGFIDRLDPRRLFFPENTVADMLTRAGKLPLRILAPKIQNSDEYIASRLPIIREGIMVGANDDRFRNITNEELRAPSTRHFVIISIDLVGSTLLSQHIDEDANARVIQTYSREVALMCGLFHGRVLKFMGDGMILYFPTGSMARRHDVAIDCVTALRDLVLVGINSVLTELELPKLACRIGVDSGLAPVVTIGDSSTTNNIDIIGRVVNIAAKIEKHAPTNGICVGESVVLNTHTMWLKHMSPMPNPTNWPYIDPLTGESYKIYSLQFPLASGLEAMT
jgi:class 3 adenylate cyclase